jgi:hypothetical protein
MEDIDAARILLQSAPKVIGAAYHLLGWRPSSSEKVTRLPNAVRP